MTRVGAYAFWAFVLGLSLTGITGCINPTAAVLSGTESSFVSFAATPTIITAGGSTSLTGVFANGTGMITPGNLPATSGTPVSVSPSVTTTYTLTVTPPSGTAITKTVLVTVTPAAPTITSFTASPAGITVGGSTSLTGIFANGAGVITPGNLPATSGTPVSVSPSVTTTYTLTVTPSSGTAITQTATVTVSPATPTITSFTASPASIQSGGSSSLTGVFANGTGVITPGNLPATSGTPVSVSPSVTTTYTLTVTPSSGTAITQTAMVTVSPATPTITSFNASPAGITVGGSTSLTGIFTNGTGVITPGNLPATSGTPVSVSPSVTTTYTLTVTPSSGTAITKTVIVTVTPAVPTITSFKASPASIAAGSSSTLSWATTGATSIAITPGTFTSTSASGSTSVSPTATTTYTLTATNAAGSTTATEKVTVKTSGGPLAIATTSCPGGTQGEAYAGCTIVASGGTPPYTFSIYTYTYSSQNTSPSYSPLPEGLSLDAATGEIGSSLIGGQGTYVPEFIVTDSTAAQATQAISFAINGSNAFLASIFPSTSIFHHRVDAATTGLPVDTSPAAPMYSGYLSESVKPYFGGEAYANLPNGIPAIEVPYNQPDVAVSTTVYQSYFTSGPIPAYAPVEGTAYSVSAGGDGHVLVYREAGGGNNPALYEMWQGIFENGPWTDSSNALWPNVSSNALTPQGNGTSDAAGLPVAPLLANADEVIGTGTPTSPNGTVQHPIRFTLNHTLDYWVWPATQAAGQSDCYEASGNEIPRESEISQSPSSSVAPYPATCAFSGAAGEIYRLKASVATPSCASASPQAAILITGFRNYGIILADNGDSGGLIGTPDARWNDDDLSCIRNLTLSDFEPVNVSSLMVSNDSGATSH